MSRSFTQKFTALTQDLLAGDPALILLTMTHPAWAQPVRIVQGLNDVVSNGRNFTALAFDLTLAVDDAKTLPQMRITIDNVDRSLIAEIRALPSSPNIEVELILASDPDTIELSFPELTVKQISYDASSISAAVAVSETLNTKFPKGTINPVTYPGLY